MQFITSSPPRPPPPTTTTPKSSHVTARLYKYSQVSLGSERRFLRPLRLFPLTIF